MTLRADDRSIYGKLGVSQVSVSVSPHFSRVSDLPCAIRADQRDSADIEIHCNDAQGGGIILVKTTQAVLVAEYVAPVLPGDATKIVENLADYLISVGF